MQLEKIGRRNWRMGPGGTMWHPTKNQRRCPQCWQWRAPDSFVGMRAGSQCSVCRCEKKTSQPRTWRGRHKTGPLLVRFIEKGKNEKLGPIPSTTTAPQTCPPSCSWYGHGCFAEHGVMGWRWRQIVEMSSSQENVVTWEKLLLRIRALPTGTVWRHNVAGDLPGDGEDIDVPAFWRLVEANDGRRGFTFTHKAPRQFMVDACRRGFTVNRSCDSLEEADQIRERFPGLPLAVVVQRDEPRRFFVTSGGNRVTVCPAQTTEGVTCATCRMCAVPGRKAIVAFRAHGSSVVTVDKLVREKRKE